MHGYVNQAAKEKTVPAIVFRAITDQSRHDVFPLAAGFDWEPKNRTRGISPFFPTFAPSENFGNQQQRWAKPAWSTIFCVGEDSIGARYYSSSLGRFMTPDWSATPEPIPYADLENPQSLNLYSYAGNNPVTATDEDGHCWVCDAFHYLRSVGYVKVDAGVGIGASVKLGNTQVGLNARDVAEFKFEQPHDTKTTILSASAQAQAGPLAVGPGISIETPKATDNQVVEDAQPTVHAQLLTGSGTGVTTSNSEVGVGGQLGAVLQVGVEVGVNMQKVVADIQAKVTNAVATATAVGQLLKGKPLIIPPDHK